MLILDTDIASAFAKAGHFEELMQLFGKVGITPIVYEELQAPLIHGYKFPGEIFKKAELVTISEEEQRNYLDIKEQYSRIGRGEVESMVVCKKRGFLFSSFDKKAVSMAKELGVSVTPHPPGNRLDQKRHSPASSPDGKDGIERAQDPCHRLRLSLER